MIGWAYKGGRPPLLASLAECYNVLVTPLEASSDVPSMAVVTERLLHEETKMKS